MADKTLFDRVKTVSPQGILLAGLVVGTLLVLLSFAVGVATITRPHADVERQVGYAAAINWSIGFTVLFPLFLYFAASAVRSTDKSLPSLDRMLVDEDGRRVEDVSAAISRRYRRSLKRSDRLALILGSLAILGSLVEWFIVSVNPLFFGGVVPEGELDWAVASLGGTAVARSLNAAFSFVAFSVQGIYVAVLLIFLVYVYVFSELIRQLADAANSPVLVPDIDSADPRRGFQRLGRVVEAIIFACGCAFMVFWLSRLQNLYLQSGSPSLWEFLRGDLGNSAITFDWKLFASALADTGGLEYSSMMVLLGAFGLLITSIVVPLHTLRRAAVEARDNARDLAKRNPRLFAQHRRDDEVAAALDDMVVWPISYPQLNQLIFWVAFAFLSLIFYRIGIAFVLLWVWRLARRAFASGETAAAPAAEGS